MSLVYLYFKANANSIAKTDAKIVHAKMLQLFFRKLTYIKTTEKFGALMFLPCKTLLFEFLAED